jgi:hypothetical protein
MAKKTTASDWDKALSSWTKKPAVTTKPTTKKKTTTTSTSDRLRENDLGRTQGPAPRPVSTSDRLRSGSSTPAVQTAKPKPKAKKKDSFSEALDKWKTKVVEPAISTSDRLRGSYNAPTKPVQYETKQPQFDYSIDRVDTRPGQFTAQQQQSPTRTTTLQPYDPNTAQGPRQQPTGINAWLPKNFAFSQPVGALAAAAAVRQPELRDSVASLVKGGYQGYMGQQTEQALDPARRVAEGWGDVGKQLTNQIGTWADQSMEPVRMAVNGWQGVAEDVGNSAAYERFGQSVDQNRQNYKQRSNWGDVGQGLVDFATNAWGDVAGMGRSLAEMSVGMKTGEEVGRGALENMNIAPYFAPMGELLDLNQYTGRLKQGAMNTLAGAQLTQDYLMTGFDVPEGVPGIGGLPLGPANASLRYSGIDLLKSIPSLLPNETNTQLRAPAQEIQRLAMNWWKSFNKYTQEYRDAVQPDTFQQGLQQGPETRAMNRERSFLNWADPESVAKTYDALTNQQTMVDEYNQTAARAWQEGAQSTSEAARDELWRQAAEAGSNAWQLENMHPQELVNQNTNIVAQLIMEVLTPDVTDLLGNVFALTGMTPAARRLTRVANEVATPTERVVRALDDMVVTAENTAQVAAQRSTYNKAWNLRSIGTARANMATDNMLRYTVNLLGDVETPRDAAYLLTQLATDPRKLITGVPGAGFQSPGLLARMDEKGLVRFGGMNLQRIKEPLRIYQQAAQNILASPVLKDGPILNKVDFVTTFMDEMNQAGYKFFNVADEAADIPTGATTARIISTGKPSQYTLEYVDAAKQVIGKSEPMTMAEARKLQKEVGGGVAAQKSLLGEVGAFQRAIVSPFYILSSPGTWATNIIGGLATAAGDGMVSLRGSKYIDDWITKQFGVDPTSRGFASVESAASSASQISSKGPFKFLKRAYGQIDEQVGKRVYYSAATKALRNVGRNTLTQTLTPILQAAGVAEKDARRIITHLYETGLQGGDLTSEFNKLLNGQTKVLALSDVNPTWLDAIPPDMVEGLNTIIRTATSRDEAVKAVQAWGQETAQYWDELIASGPSALPRYVWQKQEVLQDAAEIKQAANMATKYGDVPAEVAQATTKQLADEMTATQGRMATLTQLVTESAAPKNRYLLYNIWGQVNDLTAAVRHQLNEMADAANGLTGAAKNKAWQDHWAANNRLWTDRNMRVNQLLEDGSAAISSGQATAPRWDILERTASQNEARLWETMKLEPGSGRYDPRLKQVIDAGRAISDRAVARAYAAAIRFLNVDAMDFIVSAEHNIQMAGADANIYLDKARQVALKANNDMEWEKFFQVRNEVRRQQRQYERAVWEQSTRHITEEGIKLEAKGVTSVAAGGATQATDDLANYYNAPKPKPAQALPANTNKAIDDYLAQNAAQNPYPPEAVAALEEAGATADVFDANVERLASADVGFPGSRALDEAQGLRAERAAAAVSGGAETRGTIRAEWDRVAKGEGGYLTIDRAIQSYTRNGVVSVPERKFEDLYGTTIAGQRIDNQADVDRLLQQYYDMGQQRLQRKAAPANDLKALRQAARDAGIQTATDAGKPLDRRLVNTINKDLGLKLRGLRDLTPEQYQAAMEALARRAAPTPAPDAAATYTFVDNGGLYPSGTTPEITPDIPIPSRAAAPTPAADVPPVPFVPTKPIIAKGSTGYTATDVRKAWQDYVNTDGVPPLDEMADKVRKGRNALSKRDLDTMSGRKVAGYTFTDHESINRMVQEYIDLRAIKPGAAAPGPEMRTYDFTVAALDPEKVAKALNFGGWWGKKNVAKEQADILRRTTEAGGATAGELAHGAAFAKQQLENILTYMENNMDEILQPGQRMIGQGQNLRALEEFRKNVLPAWDNVKYAASEYGNRMRSFTMVDFANQTRLDEILGLYMPYGFWMTRTAKNSLERAIFQPQIWRRVMQAEREIRSVQEQQDAPQRYEGAFPIMSVDGVQQWLRVLPSKYWPAAGIFTSNDYADPESANTALGYAAESMRAANLSPYPWWDAALKVKENLAGGEKWNNDIYWANYLPQGRIAAAAAIKYLGPEAAQYVVPGYFENSVARTLNNMAVKGEITREQARWAHDYLWQLKQGGEELPEEMTGAYDPKAIEAILDRAMRQAAGVDLNTALTSWATGMSVRPYDTTEGQWSGAAQNYRDYKYGEQNPYGSKAAADTQKPDAALSWSKSGVWRPEDGRPGVSMATDAKSAEKEALNAELMAATDGFISGFNGTPKNFQINEFKDQWMADRVGVEGDYFGDTVNQYLDEKYPSATTFEPSGGERYPGYAPEEIQIKVRTAAYYKAKEEIDAPVFPVYPGDNATKAQYNTYFDAKDKYDADKAAYDKAIVDRVAELINDPVAMRQLAGLPVTNAPTSISDYLRSNSADTFNLQNALGYPMRPTGEGTFDAGMTNLAGDPETAAAIIEAEKTKYMSELEKQVRAANEAKGDSSGGGGYRRNSYNRRGYNNRRYSSGGGRGYSSRRYYGGGGGGGGGGNYYPPDVYAKGLSEWLNVDPQRSVYQAPNQVRVNPPDIGPEAIKAWKKLSW